MNAGESSVTYIGRKWDEAVGGWDVAMLVVSKGVREHPGQQPGMKGIYLVYKRLHVHPYKLHIFCKLL